MLRLYLRFCTVLFSCSCVGCSLIVLRYLFFSVLAYLIVCLRVFVLVCLLVLMLPWFDLFDVGVVLVVKVNSVAEYVLFLLVFGCCVKELLF